MHKNKLFRILFEYTLWNSKEILNNIMIINHSAIIFIKYFVNHSPFLKNKEPNV